MRYGKDDPESWKTCPVCGKRFRFGPPFYSPGPYRCLDCLIDLDSLYPPLDTSGEKSTNDAIEEAKEALDEDCHPYNECMREQGSCVGLMRNALRHLIEAVEKP